MTTAAIRPSQRDRILARLQRGPATNAEFVDMRILRYSARIHELRDAGHDIRWKPVKGTGLNRYWIASEENAEIFPKRVESPAKVGYYWR